MVEELAKKVIAARSAIRLHRDQMGDDRCFLDDYLLYEVLPGRQREASLLPKEEFMARCRQFFLCRQRPEGNEIAEPYEDNDLRQMNDQQLQTELERLYSAIDKHRQVGEKKGWEDDQALYLVLPEKCPGNTKLPPEPEFLESCEKFYESRGNPPKLHEW